MEKSQLNAISYAYAAKKAREHAERAAELQIEKIFEFQTIYKTLGGFVNAYETPKFKKALKNAKENAENRKNQLEKSNCTSQKIKQVLAALAQIQNQKI